MIAVCWFLLSGFVWDHQPPQGPGGRGMAPRPLTRFDSRLLLANMTPLKSNVSYPRSTLGAEGKWVRTGATGFRPSPALWMGDERDHRRGAARITGWPGWVGKGKQRERERETRAARRFDLPPAGRGPPPPTPLLPSSTFLLPSCFHFGSIGWLVIVQATTFCCRVGGWCWPIRLGGPARQAGRGGCTGVSDDNPQHPPDISPRLLRHMHLTK